MDQVKVGSFLKELRKEKNLTQENLAELLDCSVKHISHVERGSALLSLEKYVFLSDYFHCTLDYLLKGADRDDVSNVLPSFVLEILQSDDEDERELLLTYMNLYSKIKKHSDTDK